MSSRDGASEASAIQEFAERRPSGLSRGLSEESGIEKDFNYLEEIERLKTEAINWKSKFLIEKSEKERFKKQCGQLQQCLENEKKNCLEKEFELDKLQNRVEAYECQDQNASKYQAAAASLRQSYIDEIHSKNDKIKKLEALCKNLAEDNHRYQLSADRHREDSKNEASVRCSQLKKLITEAENKITDLKSRRKNVQKQLDEAEDDRESLRNAASDRSNKSKITKVAKEHEALVANLDKNFTMITESLRKAQSHLDALQAEFDTLTSSTDSPGYLDPDSSRGSYDSHYEPNPGLVEDMSSRTSGSPPQSDALDTMDTFIMDREIQIQQYSPDAAPWRRSVEPSKRLSAGGGDLTARPIAVGRRRKSPSR